MFNLEKILYNLFLTDAKLVSRAHFKLAIHVVEYTREMMCSPIQRRND